MRWLAAFACLAAGPVWAEAPSPFAALGGPFALEASNGTTRTEADPDGRHQLLFFGYANCQEICSAALPTMGQVVDALGADRLTPVMITVDPANDTADAMADSLGQHHPRFVGLTGDDASLDAAYAAFGVEREYLFTGPDGIDVYSHGSFLYLLSPGGETLTAIPPVLSPDETAAIVARYLDLS